MKCQNNLKQFGIACHAYHDTYNLFPPGGRSVQNGTGTPPSAGDNWNDDRGSWIVYTLPYMEQGNMFKLIPNLEGPPGANPVGVFRGTTAYTQTKLPYLRCPSDGYDLGQPVWFNYVGSMGPQNLPNQCGVEPFNTYANGNAQPPAPGWGYPDSPGHGNDWNATGIRGMFNRLGAKINMASVTDGTSNTIMIGESLPAEHDHLTNVGWAHFNGGVAHCSTIVPINYRSDWPDCAQAANSRVNWNVAWGFKSKHSGGANFVFVDGSVHFLPQSIEHWTYQLLGCRNDNQTPGSY